MSVVRVYIRLTCWELKWFPGRFFSITYIKIVFKGGKGNITNPIEYKKGQMLWIWNLAQSHQRNNASFFNFLTFSHWFNLCFCFREKCIITLDKMIFEKKSILEVLQWKQLIVGGDNNTFLRLSTPLHPSKTLGEETWYWKLPNYLNLRNTLIKSTVAHYADTL